MAEPQYPLSVLADFSQESYAKGYADAMESIEGTLAAAFERHPELSRDAWQAALRSVEKRAYMRGLNEGRADD